MFIKKYVEDKAYDRAGEKKPKAGKGTLFRVSITS